MCIYACGHVCIYAYTKYTDERTGPPWVLARQGRAPGEPCVDLDDAELGAVRVHGVPGLMLGILRKGPGSP